MFFRVKLDECESVVEADDTVDAIRVARSVHSCIDVKVQSAERCTDDEQLFFESERNAEKELIELGLEDKSDLDE